MNHGKVDHVLGLMKDLSVEELEQVSKALKKLIFRCRVQEKIELRREDVAQRISDVLSHRADKVREDR